MARHCAIIVTFAVAVALCLTLVGCRTQADDPGAHNAQSDPPNIEATVQAAMRSLEERQPTTPAESATSASASTPSEASATTTAPTAAESPALQPTVPLRPASDGADQRPPAPMFAGTFMDGNDYRLQDTVGSPTLLMFWAPW